MKLPDGTQLMHGRAPYDPQKAHEYYMRTRELKGRRRGRVERLRPSRSARRGETYRVKTRNGGVDTYTKSELADKKIYIAKRIESIKGKLSLLNEELRKRRVEDKRAEREANKPASKAEKAEAARDSKQYRAKNQQKLANKAAASKTREKTSDKPDSTGALEEKIDSLRTSLKAAVARQRSLVKATRNG